MQIKPIRDSGVLYLEYAEEDTAKMIEREIDRLIKQHKSNFKVCPVCQIEHMNEYDLCEVCEGSQYSSYEEYIEQEIPNYGDV